MAIIDANIILRYVLDDHEELSPKAPDILEHHSAILPMEAACEVVYVLQKVYGVDRPHIQQHLGELIAEQLITVEKASVLLEGLECYSSTTLDIVDALPWAYHEVEHHEVLTFDEKLRKYIQKTSLRRGERKKPA